MNVAAAELENLAHGFSHAEFEPIIFDSNFLQKTWKQHVCDIDGLLPHMISTYGNTAMSPASNKAPGHVTYKIDAPAGTFSSGLALTYNCRAFVSKGSNRKVNIRVLVGTSPDPSTMREVNRVFDNSNFRDEHRVDLSSVALGHKTVYVRLELSSPVPPSVLDWCALWRICFTQPWSPEIKTGLPNHVESMAHARAQNLVVSWRRDAEMAIDELRAAAIKSSPLLADTIHPSSNLKAAQDAFDSDQYALAYKTANQGLSVMLPASYYVLDSGWLRPVRYIRMPEPNCMHT